MKITDNTMKINAGCDFIVHIDEKRKIKLLQITDMQLIDSAQRRTPERLRQDEINAWHSETFDGVFGNHLKSLVAQTNPDLIFITGDMVYGSFDDNGTSLEWFCEFMDSFKIQWAPIFGNHDNESKKVLNGNATGLKTVNTAFLTVKTPLETVTIPWVSALGKSLFGCCICLIQTDAV